MSGFGRTLSRRVSVGGRFGKIFKNKKFWRGKIKRKEKRRRKVKNRLRVPVLAGLSVPVTQCRREMMYARPCLYPVICVCVWGGLGRDVRQKILHWRLHGNLSTFEFLLITFWKSIGEDTPYRNVWIFGHCVIITWLLPPPLHTISSALFGSMSASNSARPDLVPPVGEILRPHPVNHRRLYSTGQ
jgi:hypothetical protein